MTTEAQDLQSLCCAAREAAKNEKPAYGHQRSACLPQLEEVVQDEDPAQPKINNL